MALAGTPAQIRNLHLLDLPPELLLAIISHIPSRSPTTANGAAHTYASLYALRWTCRTLHALTPDPSYTATRARNLAIPTFNAVDAPACREECLAALLALENWPAYTTLPPLLHTHPPQALHLYPLSDAGRYHSTIPPESRHACRLCLRLQRSSAFVASTQLSGARAKRAHGRAHNPAAVPSALSGHDVDDAGIGEGAGLRFCIACSVREGTLTARSAVVAFVDDWEGAGVWGTGFVCVRCRRFVRGAPDSGAALRRKCDACRAYRPP